MSASPSDSLRIVSQGQALILTWILPGLGHHYAGFRRRARFYMMLLVPLFIVGQVLARGGAVNMAEHPWYFGLGQLWCGGFAILGLLVNAIVGGGGARFETYEIGQLYVTCAILMNILVWVDLARRLDDSGKAVDR